MRQNEPLPAGDLPDSGGPIASARSRAVRFWRLWSAAALLLAAGVAGYNLACATGDALRPDAAPPDAPSGHDERLAPLRRALQKRGVRGMIGYLTDQPAARFLADSAGVRDYYLTQYALAPLVLDPNPEPHAWAVGCFRHAGTPPTLPPGMRVVEDFGDGVLLLANERQ
jgi:hypothetical protein